MSLDQVDEAERWVRRGLELDPDSSEGWCNLGSVLTSEAGGKRRWRLRQRA